MKRFWTAPAERGTVVPRGDGALAPIKIKLSWAAIASVSMTENQSGVARGTAVPRLPPHSKLSFLLLHFSLDEANDFLDLIQHPLEVSIRGR